MNIANMKSMLLVLAFLFILIGRDVYATQFPDIFYGNSIEQKWLPNYSIRDVIQTKDNNIWVATSTGLYRYDINRVIHYDITRYTADKYLNNEISCIVEDTKGNILVGTQSGLGLFDLRSQKITLISGRDQNIANVAFGRDNDILYILQNGDIYRLIFDSKKDSYERKRIFRAGRHKKNMVKAVIAFDNKSYFIGASDGLWLLKDGVLSATSIVGPVNSLYKEGNTLWVATAFHGLYKCIVDYGHVTAQGSYTPRNQIGQTESIQEIKYFNEEELLFATNNKLYLVNKQAFPERVSIEEKAVFSKNTIRKVSVDRTMNIWIGSRNGLFTLNPLTLFTQFNSFDNSIYQNVFVNELMAIGNENILLATNSLGLQRLNTKTNSIENTPANFKSVKLLRKTASGDLFVLADNRFYKTSLDSLWNLSDTGTFVSQGGINDVVEVASGEFWFAHWYQKIIRVDSGIPNPRLDRIHQHILKLFSSNVHIYVMEIDSRNNLWIGTRGEGLLRINLKDQSLKKFERMDGFPDQILCIKEDRQNRLWVGTRDKGLLLYQPDLDNFKVFDSHDGLPSNTICAIQESSMGEIWLSTLNGISKLNEGKLLSFRSYNKESGVYNAEFSFNISEAGEDGSVYFGAENGIYRFSKSVFNRQAIPLVWTNIDIIKGNPQNVEHVTNGSFSMKMLDKVEESGTIVLDRDQNSLQIGFAKLDYTQPQQNFYMYRLLGRDTSWSVLQGEKSVVRYFNLPPGEYVFQAMSAGSDGTWDTEPKSFAIIIRASFWQTGYAFLLYVFIGITLIFLIYKLITRWKRVHKRLEEEMESSRVRGQQMVYYADLSHEIKNRLTLIMGPLEEALKNKKVNFQMLNRIYEQGQRLKRFSDQIMNIRRSELGNFLLTVSLEKDIIALISKIVDDTRPLAMVKDIDVTFESARQQVAGWCDAEILEIILMNVLNNAIKYCKPSGAVKVTVDTEYLDDAQKLDIRRGNYLVCAVSDTGIGIAEKDISKILLPFYRASGKFDKKDIPGKGIGLDLVGRLIRKHHGTIEIRSEENEYTIITFYLPIDKTAFSMDELQPDIKTQPIVIAEKNFNESDSLIFPDTSFEEQKLPAEKKESQYKLLFVDDDEEMLSYLGEVFHDEFAVNLANNGEQALALLRKEEVHLVVCDLDMPEMNGLTVCNILKGDDDLAHIPFLLLTGKDSEEQKLIAFEYGVDDFVEKPFRSELLSWRIKSLLRNKYQSIKLRTVMVSEPKETIKETKTEKFIQNVIDIIEENMDKNFLSVDFLADAMNITRASFYRKMEEVFGESPATFIKKYRLKKAVLYLQTGDFSIKELSYRVGFNNPKYFAKCFKEEYGVLPSQYFASEGDDE